MRGLRRIAGQMRYQKSARNISDREVRKKLEAPSVDCILLVARLRYAARLVRCRPPTLLVALHFRCKGQPLPWTQQLIEDMRALQSFGLKCPSGDPIHEADAWIVWLASESSCEILRQVHFVDSILDTKRDDGDKTGVPQAGKSFPCQVCRIHFASAKALTMHARAKHGHVSPANSRIASSMCPACGKDFHLRARCLDHLSDSRRPSCREWVMHNVHPLEPVLVEQLNAEDRLVRKKARQQGHTRVLSCKPPTPAASTDG